MNNNQNHIHNALGSRSRKEAHHGGSQGVSRFSWLRSGSQRLAEQVAVPLHYLFGNLWSGSFGILMYHRIAPHTPGFPRPTWNVTPERFRDQMRGLLDRGFTPWPLRKALQHHRKGLTMPPNTFVLTFDDGYECLYTNAWPILKELEIPATAFIVTGMLDAYGPMTYDDWPAAGSPDVPASAWRPLTKKQCRELSAFGLVDLGLHTHSHENFRDRPDAFSRDLAASIKALRELFGVTEITFAYPYGYAGQELAAITKSAGIICALTAERELVKPHTDPYSWGRFPAEQYDTSATLAAKLSGWYSAIRDFCRGRRGSGSNNPALSLPAFS